MNSISKEHPDARAVYANPPILLRPGRLRARFRISGRQWRRANRALKGGIGVVSRMPAPSLNYALSDIWRRVQHRVLTEAEGQTKAYEAVTLRWVVSSQPTFNINPPAGA